MKGVMDELKLSSVEELVLFHRLPQTGTGVYWKVLDHFPSLHAALRSAPDDSRLRSLFSEAACDALKEIDARGEQSAAVQRMREDIRWADENSVYLLDVDNDQYPALLREIRRPPPLLYVRGSPAVLSMPQVAIVGSRNPTPTGAETAHAFAKELASSGLTVTSGLALGVDVAAHQGALEGEGRTIAVLGTGVDQIYPVRHNDIARDIVRRGGALVSEFPLGTKPQAGNFPQRNRIISGLSSGVLVAEAAIKSGSLITARYALQQGREVFAIPGSIHNPLSKGCHDLIKNGAKLVEKARDIMEELDGALAFKWEEIHMDSKADRQPTAPHLDAELTDSADEGAVLEQLGYEPTPLDVLVERTHMPVGEVMSCLLTMELRGIVANMGSGYMRVRSSKLPDDLSFMKN